MHGHQRTWHKVSSGSAAGSVLQMLMHLQDRQQIANMPSDSNQGQTRLCLILCSCLEAPKRALTAAQHLQHALSQRPHIHRHCTEPPTCPVQVHQVSQVPAALAGDDLSCTATGRLGLRGPRGSCTAWLLDDVSCTAALRGPGLPRGACTTWLLDDVSCTAALGGPGLPEKLPAAADWNVAVGLVPLGSWARMRSARLGAAGEGWQRPACQRPTPCGSAPAPKASSQSIRVNVSMAGHARGSCPLVAGRHVRASMHADLSGGHTLCLAAIETHCHLVVRSLETSSGRPRCVAGTGNLWAAAGTTMQACMHAGATADAASCLPSKVTFSPTGPKCLPLDKSMKYWTEPARPLSTWPPSGVHGRFSSRLATTSGHQAAAADMPCRGTPRC